MKKLKLYVDFGRPFTLLPPALGVVSGAVTAWGAHGTRSPLTASVLLPVLWGALMAGVLNAANNAIEGNFIGTDVTGAATTGATCACSMSTSQAPVRVCRAAFAAAVAMSVSAVWSCATAGRTTWR